MAQRVQIILTDDLTEESIPEGEGRTLPFAVDGIEYEVDLSDANIAEFLNKVAPYVGVARKIRGPRGKKAKTNGHSETNGSAPAKGKAIQATKLSRDPKVIRAWAEENNIPVSGRGRVSKTVIDQYDAAHQ